MAVCVAGHQTQAQDFCDQCGLPVVAETAAATGPTAAVCPNCGAPKPANALFCETCGYDYTTGALPEQDLRTELGLPPAKTTSDETAQSDEPTPEDSAAAGNTPAATPDDAAAQPAQPRPAADAAPTGSLTKTVPWVAEVWVDPQWYAAQESTDPLPPQGPPRIILLRDSALIGRKSVSRNILPEIDCEPDVGCSRRQAYLTSANGYWYINDLDSANGTFVAPATAALPDSPITARTPVGPDVRIYVGAWTRIVVRPAIEAELPVAAN